MDDKEKYGLDIKARAVPNGWLVVVGIHTDDGVIPAVTFVPDPKHEWCDEGMPEESKTPIERVQ